MSATSTSTPSFNKGLPQRSQKLPSGTFRPQLEHVIFTV
jgi:hypothetical protein